MFPLNGLPDDNVIRPLGDDDQRALFGLAQKYGLSSLMCALQGLGESCKHLPPRSYCSRCRCHFIISD